MSMEIWDCECNTVSHIQSYISLDLYLQNPGLEKLQAIKAHDREVDDLDVSWHGQFVSSVSGSQASLWRVKDGKLVSGLPWTFNTPVKYKFKHCRYYYLIYIKL